MSEIIDSTFYRAVLPVVNAVDKSRVMPLNGIPRLFFLCGANGEDGRLSYRREQIREFLSENIANSEIIIAERFFKEYKKNNKESNSLDFEHVLSQISEKVIIIMESPSAICELGAFAHYELRDKLIVINDSSFKNSPSFINTGPLEAVRKSSKEDRVIWYKMQHINEGGKDGIAAVFHEVFEIIKKHKPDMKRIPTNSLDPSISITGLTVFFVHDLIFMMREVKYNTLIETLKIIFGENKKYDNLKPILTILISLDFISYPERFATIRSLKDVTFFKYSNNDDTVKKGFFLDRLKEKMRN